MNSAANPKDHFYNQFKGLDAEIVKLNKQTNEKKIEFKSLEERLNDKKFIKEVLEGLKAPEQEHPGKYAPAYRYVLKIEKDLITYATDFGSVLREPCPKCKTQLPVISRYKQIKDDDESIWEDQPFIMCPKDGTHMLEAVYHNFFSGL